MNKEALIFVAGHNGMVGSSIVRLLKKKGFGNLILRTSKELDLRDTNSVASFFSENKIDYVFLCAAKVGGILENSIKPGQFLYENLMIQNNVIHQSHLHKVKKLLFLGSSCIYPKMSNQPIKEEYLLSGLLEPTNQSYAIAKITGIQMCDSYREQYNCNFISAMPTNLYGPNDNFDLNSSHVIPALLRKFHEAKNNNSKSVIIWGDGSPLREFLHVDDCASACFFLMNEFNDKGPVNIGKDVHQLLICQFDYSLFFKSFLLKISKCSYYKNNSNRIIYKSWNWHWVSLCIRMKSGKIKIHSKIGHYN